jgi:hypothetical protein
MLTAINKTLRRSPRVLPFAAAVLLPFAGALAQTGVPDDLIHKNEISAGDRQTIKTVVDANKAGLSGTAAEIKKAREVLVAPLEKDGVSVPFRVAYSNALIEAGGLAALATDKNDLIAANALRIAGQGATGNTMKIVLDGLKDARPQVRYAATVAARAAFTAARNNPALSPDELSRAMRALGDVGAADTAPQPADGALQALVAAREIPNNRSAALERLTEAAGKRALAMAKPGNADPIDLAPLLRVAGPVRQDITEAEKLTPEARRGALAFGAQLLVLVDAQWKDGDPESAAAQAAKAANAILSLAATAISGREVSITTGDLVSPGKQDQFKRALKTLVGQAGTLQSDPFKIEPTKLTP